VEVTFIIYSISYTQTDYNAMLQVQKCYSCAIMHNVAPAAPQNSHQIIFLLTPPPSGMVLLTP